ncbi:hypothetical protein [Mucilaginibacter sp.]
MTKNLYILLIAFLGLSAAAAIADSIIRFQIGAEIYTLHAFAAWFLMLHITGVIGSILLLKYYYYRGYRFAFFTAIINAIANLSVAAIFLLSYSFITLSFVGRSYSMPAFLFSLGSLILYALSLTFSNIRKRFWLKLAGVCALGICLVLISAVIVHMYPKDVRINIILEKIVQWVPIAGSLINVLFIINFLGEISTLKAENTNIPRQKSLENLFGFLAIVAFVFIIVSGTLLFNQSYTQSF